jgi:hypothetical protein
MYIWFYARPDEWEIDQERECPTDDRDHDRHPHERTESACHSRDEVGPEHLPWRSDILHELIETGRLDRIDQSLDLESLRLTHRLDSLLFFGTHFFDLGLFSGIFFHIYWDYAMIVFREEEMANEKIFANVGKTL